MSPFEHYSAQKTPVLVKIKNIYVNCQPKICDAAITKRYIDGFFNLCTFTLLKMNIDL